MFIVEPGEFWMKGAEAAEFVANATAAGYEAGIADGLSRGVDIGKVIARKEVLIAAGIIVAGFIGFKLAKHLLCMDMKPLPKIKS